MSNPGPSVLIVDELEETREVLRMALERRGMNIHSTGQPEQARQLAREHCPDLIVLDLEMAESDPASLSREVQQESGAEPRLVMLGTFRQASAATGQFVAKPYHYAALINKIESILEELKPPAEARSAPPLKRSA